MNALDTLIAYRPTDEDLESAWPTEDRPALRARVIASSAEPRVAASPDRWVSRHRRWVAAGTVAACLAAAGVVVGAGLPSGTPGAPDAATAATIERLAVVAGEQGGTVGKDQFAYTSIVYTFKPSTDGPPYPPMPNETLVDGVVRQRVKQWSAPNGDVWLYKWCLREIPADYREPASNNPNPISPEFGQYSDASAAELAKLPTDPTSLAAFLDAHPDGDNRGTRSRVMAVTDLVRPGLASPELRAASIRVLAQSDGIEVRTGVRDDKGRPAIRVDYTTSQRVKSRFFHRYKDVTESLFFDPRTSRLLEEQTSVGGKVGATTVIEESRIVDAVPTDLSVCPPRAVQPG